MIKIDNQRIVAAICLEVSSGDCVLLYSNRFNDSRKNVSEWPLEGVFGEVDNGEDVISAVRREVLEEVGAECRAVKQIGRIYSDPSASRKEAFFFVCEIGNVSSVSFEAPFFTEDGEELMLVRFRVSELRELLVSKVINSLLTYVLVSKFLGEETAIDNLYE